VSLIIDNLEINCRFEWINTWQYIHFNRLKCRCWYLGSLKDKTLHIEIISNSWVLSYNNKRFNILSWCDRFMQWYIHNCSNYNRTILRIWYFIWLHFNNCLIAMDKIIDLLWWNSIHVDRYYNFDNSRFNFLYWLRFFNFDHSS
jgi:hypothetical protein